MKLFITVEIEEKDVSEDVKTWSRLKTINCFSLAEIRDGIPTQLKITNLERKKDT